jgi:hypothetical protein
MLKICQHQADAVAASAFIDRTVAHLRRYYSNAVASLSELELRARVIHCIARGRAHGLTWEYSLTVFASHMITLCPTFDRHPEVARILEDSPLAPDERMDELLSEVPDPAWQEIVASCDAEGYWRRVASGEEVLP